MEDGALSVTLVQPGPALQRLSELRRLYDGSLERLSGVVQVRATQLSVSSSEGSWLPLDLDGEARGGSEARFWVQSGGLTVRDGRT